MILRELQKQVNKELKLVKVNYEDKVETLLSPGNSCPARGGGMESMMGVQSKECPISLTGKTDSDLANDLAFFL